MAGDGTTFLRIILQWIYDDVAAKQNIFINKNEWQLIITGNQIPQQRNGYDCGLFVMTLADYVSDNLPLQYSQTDMPRLRIQYASNLIQRRLYY